MTTTKRIWLFRFLSIFAGVVVALILGELALVVHAAKGTVEERMDEGLIVYHSSLGWKLMPGWRGSHQHNDYVADYSVDFVGMRNSTPHARPGSPKVLVVGDSFTFGLGVGDDETFVSRLNAGEGANEFVNAAIPGYAPDQVMLWLETAIALVKPDSVLFVVYLGNDLIDIGLPFPVQATHGKPYVELDTSGQLEVRNVPVPRLAKPADLAARSLGSYILDESDSSVLRHSRIVNLVLESGFLARDNLDKSITTRLAPKLLLFDAVLGRMLQTLDVPMRLVLMPGASVARAPGSVSARYQQMVQSGLLQIAARRNLTCIVLNEVLGSDTAGLYFPLDGHLTPAGHDRVARHLLAVPADG